MSQSLDRGLRILDEIAAGRTTLSDISESLGVHKSTVLRLLVTLQQHHFVHRADAHHYRLGRRLFDLASFAIESRDVASVARPAMDRLRDSTGGWVHLATHEEGEAVVVAVAAGRGPHAGPARVGEVLPLHAPATAVLAAALPQEQMETLLGQAVPRTEIDAVRQAGFAVGRADHRDEHRADVATVAAPVRDSTGAVVAAMTLTLPRSGVPTRVPPSGTPRLLEACDEVSRELGWT
ncbi:IclR family transcriptional regulator [Pseudonocardia kunmingensis]|uniref:IclR family transcriptional regulator n=1 Tax=Pseudonocardia kunmingensis TaxID=630975 RepID=A0A543DQV6_9PSEU|nr:IclR family transcriptional regulator [Pseudonocardia kunmingensis]TQM11712.1 IclR family transcriptional regulator [Pseudonocardia kunmingensis]